ncbi:MAG: hypothetical protein P1P90_02270 [Patescibacteria group bacterium]|nr:hypothetical protein [Patescibacteria group bacterium]
MKKYLPIVVLLLVCSVALFFYLENNKTEKREISKISNARYLVSTSGWKEYSNDTFSIKYPPNYVVNDELYKSMYPEFQNDDENVITITEAPDNEILEGGAYMPGAWAGIDIFSPVEFICDGRFLCGVKDDSAIPHLDFLSTEWSDLLNELNSADGNSPKKSGTSILTLNGKQVVNRWFLDARGAEGLPLSENNLYIKIDDNHILPIRGIARKNGEENLAIIETMYSTIVFKK